MDRRRWMCLPEQYGRNCCNEFGGRRMMMQRNIPRQIVAVRRHPGGERCLQLFLSHAFRLRVGAVVGLIPSERRQRATQHAQSLADVRVEVEIETAHLPVDVHHPLDVLLRVAGGNGDGAGADLVGALWDDHGVHHDLLVLLRLPIVPRYLKVVGEPQTEPWWWTRTFVNLACQVYPSSR